MVDGVGELDIRSDIPENLLILQLFNLSYGVLIDVSKIRQVWEFSNLFYPVDKWCLDKFPSMSEHLKVCPYYEKENKTEPVLLTGIYDSKEDEEKKEKNLVSMFIRNK